MKLKTDSNTQQLNKPKAPAVAKDLNISKEKTQASFSGNNSKLQSSLFANQAENNTTNQDASKELKPKAPEATLSFLNKTEDNPAEKEKKELDFGK